MLRIFRLAASSAAMAVAGCCLLPEEPGTVELRRPPRTASAHKTQEPRAQATRSAKGPAATPAAYVVPMPPPTRFPKSACRGPRDKGQVESGKVVDGWGARIGDWPGFVALRMHTEGNADAALYFCGGSAIAPNWVVTAAHCVHGEKYARDARGLYQDMAARFPGFDVTGNGYFEVVEGTEQLSGAEPRGTRVKSVITHPGYTKATAGKDIALLELEAPLEGPFALLSLSSATDPSDLMPTRSMVAGFGRTEVAQPGLHRFGTRRGGTVLAMSDNLLETTVPTASKASCAVKTTDPGRMCAAEARYGGRDSCNGDSGGPLVVFDRDKCPYVVGLTSYGDECGQQGSYGIYTRVSAYAEWIRSYVPQAMTTVAPIDKVALERTYSSVWAAVTEIEKQQAARPSTQRIAIELCKYGEAGCEPRGSKPLVDGEGFRVGVSVPAGRIVIAAVSARGDVRQLHPVDEPGEAGTSVVADAVARWQYEQGRIIAIALPAGAAPVPEITAAREAEGRVGDPVAYMKALNVAARQVSSVGVLELAVQQR